MWLRPPHRSGTDTLNPQGGRQCSKLRNRHARVRPSALQTSQCCPISLDQDWCPARSSAGRRSRGAPFGGKTLARRAIAWQHLDDPVDVRTREQALFATTGQDLVSCRRSAQKLLAPLGIVDNNSSESPPVFIYQTIAAAWNAERSMERTGAAGLLNDEGHPNRKSGTQWPLPHGA
jgi:hypothetical protein